MKKKILYSKYVKLGPFPGEETTPPIAYKQTTNPMEELTTPSATIVQLTIPEDPPTPPMEPTIPTTTYLAADVPIITPISAEPAAAANIMALNIPTMTPLST